MPYQYLRRGEGRERTLLGVDVKPEEFEESMWVGRHTTPIPLQPLSPIPKMITPLVVTIDRTGDYDNFLRNLETRLPSKAQPGDVRFILHADATKELYIPRRNQRSTYQLYINPSNLQTVETATDDAHQNIAMLLRPHSSESGYYVLWENPQTMLLINILYHVLICGYRIAKSNPRYHQHYY